MSGGTYSLFRVAYGVWLGWQLVAVAVAALDGRGVGVETAAAMAGALACLPFALGFRDRLAALVIAPAFFIAFGAGNGAGGLVLSFVSIVPLLVHVALPQAPYGSLDAYGRPDPGGDFVFPKGLSFSLRAVLAGGYGAVALRSFGGPAGDAAFFEWAFAAAAAVFFALAFTRRQRSAGWLVMLMALIARGLLVDDPLGVPLLFAHFLLFDPALIPPLGIPEGERVFYDGGCGLCHRAVRFALAEDQTGAAFRFAPLHGEAFSRELDGPAAHDLPDSIVVVTEGGDVLVRSRAIFRMMAGLGGVWRVAATALRLFPQPIADGVYDGVAVVRHRIFQRPADVCPVIPKRLRGRFDA